MSEFTPKYNLEKPSQDDFYDVDVHNRNMDKVEKQLSLNEEAIKNIDVSTSIKSVIDERVNDDISKPLNKVISGLIDSSRNIITGAITNLTSHVTNTGEGIKTAILEGISTLTNHVTSQHTATKNHVSQERGNTQQTVTACRDQVQNTVNVARDNINATVNVARDNIKEHVTAQVGGIKSDYFGRTISHYNHEVGNTSLGTNGVINLLSTNGSGLFDVIQLSSSTLGVSAKCVLEIVADGVVTTARGINLEWSSYTVPFKSSLVIRIRSITGGTHSGSIAGYLYK